MPFLKAISHLPLANSKGQDLPTNAQRLKTKGAFTLIELLIVITIIGILSAIGVMGYQGSQKTARDAQRKNDLQQVKRAMEIAKNDCRAGSYYAVIAPAGNANIQYQYIYENFGTGTNLMGYMDSVPADPKATDTDPKYELAISDSTDSTVYSENVCADVLTLGTPSAGAKNYVLRAKLEDTTDPDMVTSYNSCKSTIDAVYWATTPSSPTSSDPYFYVCPD